MKANKVNLFGKTFVRITKQEARKRFNAEQGIVTIPVNANPYSIWYRELFAQPITWRNVHAFNNSFESFVNASTALNCNREEGKFLAYYKEL